MKFSKQGRKRSVCYLVAAVVVNLLAILFISVRMSSEIGSRMTDRVAQTGQMFEDVMDNYKHSFRLFTSMMSNEIRNQPDPDDLWDFLKSIDSEMLEIEGETFDGLYMYYKGRYLYSWDTPYSQYEETGYVATERPWYTDAVNGDGEIVFTPPYMSYANNYILTTISQLQPDGETVFAYDIKMGDIQQLTTSMEQYDREQVFIYDANGTIIGSSTADYLGGNLYDPQEAVEQSVASVAQELASAENESQASKLTDQLDASTAFLEFRKSFDGSFQKLSQREKAPVFVSHNGTGYYGIVYKQEDFNFLVMVPVTSMLKATVSLWLVPLLIVELLLIYALSRISRDMKNRELKAAYVELGQTQKRLEVALSAAQKAAAIDDLTGMMNFKSFHTEFDKSLAAMDEDERGILIMIDGDHFKQINDQYGHSIGDEVIKLSAQMIVGRIRIVDLASRLHGDEFAIFVANTSDYSVARGIMDDINQAMKKEARKRNMPSITLSAGAVVAKHGDSYTALARLADEALYKAKETHNGGFAY